MCRTCRGRFSVRERFANHDFFEQLREFHGLPVKHYKNRARKNLKKSLFNRIENRIYRLQVESEFKYTPQLRSLLEDLNNTDVKTIEYQFRLIMMSYYREKLGVP